MAELAAYDKTSVVSADGTRLSQPVVIQPTAAPSQAGVMPALAPIQSAPGDVSAIGAVANLPYMSGGAKLANAITFTLANATGSTKVYYMFNAFGLLQTVGGITTAVQGLYNGNSNLTTAFNAQTVANPYTFSGFNIQSAVSAATLQQPLNFYEFDATGTMTLLPINLGTAERNTSYNNQLQTFQFPRPFTATGNVAVTFSVPDGETVTVTWFVAGSNNRLF